MKHGDSESGGGGASKGAGGILHPQIFDEAPNFDDRVRTGSFVFVPDALELLIIASGAFLAVFDLDPGPADVLHVFLVIVVVEGDPLGAFPFVLAVSELVEPLAVLVVVVLRVERGLQVLAPVDVCVRSDEFVDRLAVLIDLLISVAKDFHFLVGLDLGFWMFIQVAVPQIVLQPLRQVKLGNLCRAEVHPVVELDLLWLEGEDGALNRVE